MALLFLVPLLQLMPLIPQSQAARPIVNDPIPQKRTIEVGANTSISITAADPDNDPLSYEWSVVSGTITGAGRTVTYNAPSVVPVANVDTVTVTVNDGENTVSKSVTIRIEAPSTPTKLYFAPNSGNIELGGMTKEIKIFLDAGPISVSQVDLDILYNSSVLELVDQNPSQPGTQIQGAPAATEILRNETAPTSTTVNHIIFSAKFPDIVGERQHVASLHFRALKEQTNVELKFQFLKFATNDTNVIKSGTTAVDALESIEDARFDLITATKPFGIYLPPPPPPPPPAAIEAPLLPGAAPLVVPTPSPLIDTGPSDTILAGIAFFLFIVYLLLKVCAPKRS